MAAPGTPSTTDAGAAAAAAAGGSGGGTTSKAAPPSKGDLGQPKFRIGLPKHGYVYSMHPEFLDATHHCPIYQCCRDREENTAAATAGDDRAASCLWLFKAPEGYWQANSAPTDCEDPMTQGMPVFRTLRNDVNATLPGWYQWQAWERGCWRYDMFFETSNIY